MKLSRLILFLVFVFSMTPVLAISAAQASPVTPAKGAASAVVTNFYGQLLLVMKTGDKLGYLGRYKKLSPTIRTTFNLPLMTRYTLGSLWSSASPGEQEQLVSAFSDFSVATYANRFASFDGEKFNITDEKPLGDGVLVETKLTPKDSPAVALNYLLKLDDKGNYRVVDVFMGGAISELATRREEFGSIAKKDGIEALVNSLSAKSKEMGPS